MMGPRGMRGEVSRCICHVYDICHGNTHSAIDTSTIITAVIFRFIFSVVNKENED